MSRKYNKTFTSLKTVVHDTSILDAQKILVKVPDNSSNEHTDIIDYINGSINNTNENIDTINTILGNKIFESSEKSTATTVIEWDAIHYKDTTAVPHNTDIVLITLIPQNTNISVKTYLAAWYVNSSNEKTWLGMSDNAITWDEGKKATWTFLDNPLNVPDNCKLELFLTTSILNNPSGDPSHPGVYFASEASDNKQATHRYEDYWDTYGGTPYTIFNSSSLISNEDVLESIDTAVNGILTEGLTFNTNTVNGTLDNATIKGIQYSNEHFVTDAHITSITIPYNYQSDASSTGYLYIEIINEEGIVINSAYSVGTGSFNDSSSGEHNVTFNFSDFYIPENYKLVRLALVTNKTTVPNIVTTENCLSFRARPIKLNDNVNYDGDDCMIYASATSTQNWVIALTVTYNQIVGGLTDDILYNNIRAERLLKDVNSLTAASKTHISSEEAQNKFANKTITETTLGEIGYIHELAADAAGDGECDAIHYAANKIPHNIVIDEIRIPTLNDSPKPLYLAVWIINQSDAKTYIGLSDSTTTWSAGGTAIWKFTNNPINVPENYRLELFLAEAAPASGANQVPASSNYIKTFVNYSGSGTARYADRWYSGRDIRTIFVKNGIVVNHEERINILEKNGTSNEGISQLQADVSELQSKNYAYTDGDNTFTGANNFTGTLTLNQKNIVTSDYMSDINWDSDMSTDPYIGINSLKVSGPYIYFRRGDSTTSAGSLELSARNATSASKTLKLNTDGTLTWCGKNILTDDIAVGFIGEIKFSSYDSVPSGYLICDGSKISRTTYSALFKVIGTKWGTGDGSTTFTLPNLIDRVAWGAKTAGTYKSAGLPNITGSAELGKGVPSAYGLAVTSTSGAFSSIRTGSLTDASGTNGGTNITQGLSFNAKSSNSIYGASTTVQPPAATLVPIIRYI